METPEYIMEKIRQREGLKLNDKSQDESLKSMTPETKLRKVVSWELGDGNWADDILRWAKDCGFIIST